MYKSQQGFQQLCTSGQRKEALEVSVKYQLWSLALMISTTLSSEIQSDTMQRFSNSLHVDEPLKSFSQLISSVEPSSCSNSSRWRQHLAMILSNQSDKYDPNFNYVLSLANTLGEFQVFVNHFFPLILVLCLTLIEVILIEIMFNAIVVVTVSLRNSFVSGQDVRYVIW